MAYAYPDEVVEAKFFWSSATGIRWTNTLHYRGKTPTAPFTPADLANLYALIGPPAVAFAELTNVQTTLEVVQLTDMSLVNGGPPPTPRSVFPGSRVVQTVGQSGLVSGDPLPLNVALIAINHSGSSLRRFNPKNWWAGWSESDQDGAARPDGNFLTATEAALGDLIHAENSAWVGSAVSYVYSAQEDILDVDVQPYWRTRRQRVL